MKKPTQKDVAQKAGISQTHFCEILAGSKRTSWEKAEILSQLTGISTEIWMKSKSDPETLRIKFKEYQSATNFKQKQGFEEERNEPQTELHTR